MHTRRIESIEVARGIAALLVVFFHATGIIGLEKYFGSLPFDNFWRFGYAGVDFFFVLSGFVIYYSTSKSLAYQGNVKPYLVLRCLRIYPPYVILCILALPLMLFVFSYDLSLQQIIFDFLLLPREQSPFITVAWTLRHEMLFYLLFSVFFFSYRLGASLFLLWFLGICANFSGLFVKHYLVEFIFSKHNLEFMFGLLIARHTVSGKTFPPFCFHAGFILFSGAGIIEWQQLSLASLQGYHLVYGVASSLVIMGLLHGRQPLLPKLRESLLVLGKASYSLYLVHFLVLSASIKVIYRITPQLNPEICWIILVIIATFSGIIYWHFIEKPAINFCKKQLGSPTMKKGL